MRRAADRMTEVIGQDGFISYVDMDDRTEWREFLFDGFMTN